MITAFIFYLHYAFLLAFGISISLAFAGIKHSKRTFPVNLGFYVLCGLLQILVYCTFGEDFSWKIYPLMTHVPIGLFLHFYYHKHPITALTAITSSYLFCQPANCFGIIFEEFFNNEAAEYTIRILVLVISGIIAVWLFVPNCRKTFARDKRSILIFSIIPVLYYIYDYSLGIYSATQVYERITSEIMPFILCMVYIFFCIIYSKENEQKSEAEYKEHLFQLTVDQQSKEIDSMKRSQQEIRLLKHDLRLILRSILVCLENNDSAAAKKIINEHIAVVDPPVVGQYCGNVILNYIISDFATKCEKTQINFLPTIAIDTLSIDEIAFSSILSNALDNAFNAQEDVPAAEKKIKLMLKESDGKLLLSVKNTYQKAPIFVEGLPISTAPGHGYGVQSIRYTTERLGGKCQFTVQDKYFVARVIINN